MGRLQKISNFLFVQDREKGNEACRIRAVLNYGEGQVGALRWMFEPGAGQKELDTNSVQLSGAEISGERIRKRRSVRHVRFWDSLFEGRPRRKIRAVKRVGHERIIVKSILNRVRAFREWG